jgi:hypothetical protein
LPIPVETPIAAEPERIDRVAPTRRPNERVVMKQRWAELGFLHWALPPPEVAPILPSGLTLDTFQGKAYVGLVPFTVTGARLPFTPALPFVSDFHEVNVRTYVHLRGRDPGVWFFSLDAASAPAVAVARLWFKLPYQYARMRLERSGDRARGETSEPGHGRTREIRYFSERIGPGRVPATCALVYGPGGPERQARPGTLAHFLVERYVLYAEHSGRLYRARVHHPPYPVQDGFVGHIEESLVQAAGLRRPDEAPLVHYAREVRVEVFPLRRVGDATD